MFAVADLIVLNAIESGLENLRLNPSHLEFILGKYEETSYMRELHGSAFVRQCKDLVLQNKIRLRPYYVLDAAKLPSVAVVAQYQESIQVLGDFGTSEDVREIEPEVLGSLMAVGWGEEATDLIIGSAVEVCDWIYAGAYLRQDEWIGKINLIIPQENDRAIVSCDSEIPKNRLIDWQVVTAPASRIATINASGNEATVSIDLKSSGDIETHKLLAMVIRYCLKKGRLLMDENGLQITTSSQNFPMAFDEEQGIFQTVFTLQGKIWDCWIQSESDNYVPSLSMCGLPPEVTSEDQIVHFTF